MNRLGSIAALAAAIALPGCTTEAAVRPPAVAGSFYPADAKQLEAAVKGFIRDAVALRGEKPIALVVPHAGYVFSGQIAADAFAQAIGSGVEFVVILGTNHTVPRFDGVSVFQGEGYRTPLGTAKVDTEVAKALSAAGPRYAFRPEAHASEHSEEVQVPFVQVAFPHAKIVPAIVGSPDPKLAESFAKVLAGVLQNRKALIVASSDLSHYPAYADAVEADRATLTAMASLEPGALTTAIASEERKRRPNLVTSACGEAPVLVAMHAARLLGARRGVVLSYANSGDSVAGERDRVVGYGAVMFTAGQGGPDTRALERAGPPPSASKLSADDRKALLKLARETLEGWVNRGVTPLPRTGRPALRRNAGAFVTLTERGELRGCIGRMTASDPLAETVARMTVEAATRDPRFPPVTREELPSIDIEVSVLTPMARVAGPQAIEVGRDGVLLEKDGRSAVFLPQVAPEQGWNRDEMLDNLCAKAGLPSSCWRSGAAFSTFQADVFGEPRRR